VLQANCLRHSLQSQPGSLSSSFVVQWKATEHLDACILGGKHYNSCGKPLAPSHSRTIWVL
jgi:hypothetical protein